MSKRKPLTKLEKGMLKGLLTGKSDFAAYRDAGGTGISPSSARDCKRGIREKVSDLADRIGATDEKLLRDCLLPALNATDKKFAQKDGRFTDVREVVNWEARLKALDMAFNLKGSYAARPGTRVEVAGDGEISVRVTEVE